MGPRGEVAPGSATEEEPKMADRAEEMGPGEIVEAVAALKDEILGRAEQASERLQLDRRMAENPWMVLGLAAGAGFVLGGGLWPALRPIVRAAGRWAVAPTNLIAIATAVGAMCAQAEEGERAKEEEEPSGEPGPVTH
jgi:ElaB/YqjD/DUF883 family membrane-anchored ribosome-binding protein